jgi:hypothetical protein
VKDKLEEVDKILKVMHDAHTPVSIISSNVASKFTSLRSWINKDDYLQNNTFSEGQLAKLKKEAEHKKA